MTTIGTADGDRTADGGPSQETVERLTKDELFHLLQNERRRATLRLLRGADEPSAIRELADHVAAAEHDTTVEELSSEERQRAYISLYQSHLPKLHDAGAVDYDQDAGTVERTAVAAQFDPYLDEVAPDAGTSTATAADDDGWFDRVRSPASALTGIVSGVMVGVSVGSTSLLFFLGTLLLFVSLFSQWGLRAVTSVAA